MMRGRTFRTNHPQILAIFAFRQFIQDALQLPLVDEVRPERDFLEACDLKSLPMLDRRDVISRFEQTRLGSSIEPGHAATERFHVQLVSFEINRIQICDLQLVACGGLQLPAELDHAAVVNVETGNREIALRLLRFFLEAQRAPVRAKLDHAVSLRIAHLITENACAGLDRECIAIEIEVPIENIVADIYKDTGTAEKIS